MQANLCNLVNWYQSPIFWKHPNLCNDFEITFKTIIAGINMTAGKTDPKLHKETHDKKSMRYQRDAHFTCCTKLTW